jgi:hypothetical protein
MHEEIPLRHWHLRDPGVVPNLLNTGAGSPTGICLYEGRLLPEVFWDQIIHCDAGPSIVDRHAGTARAELLERYAKNQLTVTRQIEYAKEEGPAAAGYPRYGNTVLNAPADWTWLRVVKETTGGAHRYTAYSSRDDGMTWTRGGTWTHDLGRDLRLGLVSMGGSGFTATFDEVRISGMRRS